MFRGLTAKSIKIAIKGGGMVYVGMFVASSMIYLLMFSVMSAFLTMVLLSFIAIISSILSDKKTVKQFLLVLLLSGARKKLILVSSWAYCIVRCLPVLIAYASYAVSIGDSILVAVVVVFYTISSVLLTHLLYWVVRR